MFILIARCSIHNDYEQCSYNEIFWVIMHNRNIIKVYNNMSIFVNNLNYV